jgi:hypothetical protein
MLHKKLTSPILIIASLIALTVVTAASFNHDYSALAVSKSKKTGESSGTSTLGGSSGSSSSSSSSSSAATANTLTKKELSSFISCINTANKSGEGLTHKIVTSCLDTARGLSTTGTGAATASAAGGSNGLGSSSSSGSS